MKTKKHPHPQPPTRLLAWLAHPGAADYFGRRFQYKLDVLAAIVDRKETLAAVARRYGASKQTASIHAKHAREAFGLDKL